MQWVFWRASVVTLNGGQHSLIYVKPDKCSNVCTKTISHSTTSVCSNQEMQRKRRCPYMTLIEQHTSGRRQYCCLIGCGHPVVTSTNILDCGFPLWVRDGKIGWSRGWIFFLFFAKKRERISTELLIQYHWSLSSLLLWQDRGAWCIWVKARMVMMLINEAWYYNLVT